MTGTRPDSRLIAIVCLLVGGASAAIYADNLGALTNQQLAEARNGTARYHNVDEALADGYASIGFNSAEGTFEYVNFGLVDCTFDPAHPEALAYVASGNGLRLVGVEYAIPKICTAPNTPPEGFAGDADEWETETGLPLWRLGAAIWSGSHAGPFGGGD